MLKPGNRIVQLYSREKLDEFAGMTVEARLIWLEEANKFINTVLGFEKRSKTDDRFKDFPLMPFSNDMVVAAVGKKEGAAL